MGMTSTYWSMPPTRIKMIPKSGCLGCGNLDMTARSRPWQSSRERRSKSLEKQGVTAGETQPSCHQGQSSGSKVNRLDSLADSEQIAACPLFTPAELALIAQHRGRSNRLERTLFTLQW